MNEVKKVLSFNKLCASGLGQLSQVIRTSLTKVRLLAW